MNQKKTSRDPEVLCAHAMYAPACQTYCTKLRETDEDAACAGVCGTVTADYDFYLRCQARPEAALRAVAAHVAEPDPKWRRGNRIKALRKK
jgi:hypothetical protein